MDSYGRCRRSDSEEERGSDNTRQFDIRVVCFHDNSNEVNNSKTKKNWKDRSQESSYRRRWARLVEDQFGRGGFLVPKTPTEGSILKWDIEYPAQRPNTPIGIPALSNTSQLMDKWSAFGRDRKTCEGSSADFSIVERHCYPMEGRVGRGFWVPNVTQGGGVSRHSYRTPLLSLFPPTNVDEIQKPMDIEKRLFRKNRCRGSERNGYAAVMGQETQGEYSLRVGRMQNSHKAKRVQTSDTGYRVDRDVKLPQVTLSPWSTTRFDDSNIESRHREQSPSLPRVDGNSETRLRGSHKGAGLQSLYLPHHSL